MTMQNELVERLIELIDEWRTRRTDIQLTDQCLSDLRAAIASVLNEQPKHYQLCPKCNGQGIISKPSYIAGDVETFTSSQLTYECNLCNGEMVIPIPAPLTISKQPRIEDLKLEPTIILNKYGLSLVEKLHSTLKKTLEDLQQLKKQKNGK